MIQKNLEILQKNFLANKVFFQINDILKP